MVVILRDYLDDDVFYIFCMADSTLEKLQTSSSEDEEFFDANGNRRDWLLKLKDL